MTLVSEDRTPARRSRGRAGVNRRKKPPLRARLRPGTVLRRLGSGLGRRRRTLISVTCAASLIAAGYGAGRYLATAERFAIAEAELRGAQRVTPEQLRHRIGDAAGVNIFRVNLSRAEARVAGHPWVESARVRRDLPNRLVVEVSERVPAAVAQIDGFFLVDDRGRPFVRISSRDAVGEDLVVITGVDRDAYARDPQGTHEALGAAIAAAEEYARHDRPRLGEVHIGEGGKLTFSTYEDAVEIRIGASADGDVGARLRGFDAAWSSLSERERATARLVRVEGTDAPERVTIDFSGLIAGN